MTEKELRKLNRYQLLELLVLQTERADELQKKVEELEIKLEERELDFSKLGSIAEAAVQISGVFEASQQAADMYLNSAKKEAADIIANARSQAASIISHAERKVRYISKVYAQQEECNVETGKQNTSDEET